MKLIKSLYKKYIEAKSACNKEISTNDIVNNLTNIQQLNDNNVVFCQADHFAFLIRTIKTDWRRYTIEEACSGISDLPYISCSIINQNNISHFENGSAIILAYDIVPEHIAHIFPADSFSYKIMFENDKAVSKLPSQWLPYKDFTKLNNSLKTYNEVICKTNLTNQPFKPNAIICINKLNRISIQLAKVFNLKLILIKPCKETINNSGDVTGDFLFVEKLSKKLDEIGIPKYVEEMLNYMNFL